MPLLGAVAWAGALLGSARGIPLVVLAAGGAVVAAVAVVVVRRRPGSAMVVAGTVLVLLAALAVAGLRAHQVEHNPVSDLAREGAVVSVRGTVASDPVLLTSGRADQVMWRLRVTEVRGRGRVTSLVTPVLVLAGADTSRPALGATVRVGGRLVTADGDELAGLLLVHGEPEVLREPSPWWNGAAAVRRSLRESVSHRPEAQRALVPALVVGDDSALPDDVESDFRTTGLTHLLAVSGTNLTLVVGFLLALARWCRVRGRWLVVVGAAGVVGFVLLARTEPSVLRAAAMGTVALVGLGHDGRQRGMRALGVAVLALVLVDPGLAVSAGFVLSVLATAGILVLAPGMRDSLARWLPRWLAEAVAVPLAAQLACTPVVAAISGQVSLVAVAANVLAAPRWDRRRCWASPAGCSAWCPGRRDGRSGRSPRCASPGSSRSRTVVPTFPLRPSDGGPARCRWCCSPCWSPASRSRPRGCCVGRPPVWAAASSWSSRSWSDPATSGGRPRVGHGRLRRRPGRRAGPACRLALGGRRGRGAGPGAGGRLPGPARRPAGPAAGTDPLPRRPRRRAVRSVGRTRGRRRGGHPAARPPAGSRGGARDLPGRGARAAVRRLRGDGVVRTAHPADAVARARLGPERSRRRAVANDASVVLLAQAAGLRILLTGDVEPPRRRAWPGCCPGSRSTC